MLLDYSREQLKEKIVGLGFPVFRANQLFDALQSAKKIKEITNLPKSLLEKIEDDYPSFEIIKKLSADDGTIKYVFKLNDGNTIESVLLHYKYGNTICVSTQVGCRMGCKFCASSLNGLIRNLSCGEILEQVLYVNKDQGGDTKKRAITNVVLMGMGEPLDNYENVSQFLKLVSNEDGINISQRNITLSTCGMVPYIYKLADDGFAVTLTISLHAVTDEKRKEFMPIAKTYKISEIIEACKYYFNKTKRRISFEYSLISGKNDSNKDADDLVKLLKGLPCHVNVIALNNVPERKLMGVPVNKAYAFVDRLVKGGLSATKRRTMGENIGGACGQLRASLKSEGE